jgi:hypothetical protein
MYEQTELAPLISQWEAEGKWINRGTWSQVHIALAYGPTS